MSRSRRPKCPHGRARCGVCSGIVQAGRRARERALNGGGKLTADKAFDGWDIPGPHNDRTPPQSKRSRDRRRAKAARAVASCR